MIEDEGGGYRPSHDVDALARQVRSEAPGCDLIVLETASRMGGDETNPANSMLIMAAEQLARATGAAVLLVSHVAKSAAREKVGDGYAPRGGGALTDNARGVLTLTGIPDADREKHLGPGATDEQAARFALLALPKINCAPARPPMPVELVPTRWGRMLAPYAGTEEATDNRKTNAREERHAVGKRLGEVVARLTAHGVEVTVNLLKESYLGEIGVTKNKVHPAVLAAIDDEFLAWTGEIKQGGGQVFGPGRLAGSPGVSLPGTLQRGSGEEEGERERTLSRPDLLGGRESSPPPETIHEIPPTGFLGGKGAANA